MAENEYKPCGPGVICESLSKRLQPGHYAKGLNCATLMNMNTGKMGSTVIMYKTSASDRGLVLNFCPFCGKEINCDVRKSEEPLAEKVS